MSSAVKRLGHFLRSIRLERRKDTGRSLHFVLIASFLSCMGLLLIFVLLMLVPRLSALLEKNAIERTKETVMQSVNTVDNYVDHLLSTLYYATTLLPADMDTDTAGWMNQMELVKRGNSSIVAFALSHAE